MRFTELRAHFEGWARDNFSAAQIRSGQCDDTGYPGWQTVEDLFARCVASKSLTSLGDGELRGLLFLIARTSDVGRIIAWLSNGRQFSNIAELSEHDTLFLAEASLGFTGIEYDAARQQLAKVLDRVEVERDGAIAVLERLYEAATSTPSAWRSCRWARSTIPRSSFGCGVHGRSPTSTIAWRASRCWPVEPATLRC